MSDATTGPPDSAAVWAAVGNVKDPCMIGPDGGQPQRGTKHFRAGAKVFVIDAYWGNPGTVTVIGHHRKSGRLLCIALPAKHIENPRTKLVYSPTVRRLVEEHFGSGRALPDKEYADRLCDLITGEGYRGGIRTTPVSGRVLATGMDPSVRAGENGGMSGPEALAVLDLRVGRVQRAEPNERARKPAYKLWIDFGPLGVKQSSAQVTDLYTPGDLAGRLVVAAVNLGTRNVAGFASEVLVLGLPDAQGRVVLLAPERDVPPGNRVY
jgi:tRNA-binding protein